MKIITDSIIEDVGIHFISDDNLQCKLGITLSKNEQGKWVDDIISAILNDQWN